MMKIYRYYRVGFLVGLLSFNILLSCVATKKDCFSCPGPSTVSTLFADVKETCSSCSTFNKAVCVAGSFVVFVISSTIGGFYYFVPNYSGNRLMANTTHHTGTTGWLLPAAGGITTTPGPLVHPNIDAQKIDLILNATTNNPADGFDTTISVAPLHTTSTTDRPIKLRVKEPMVLEKEVLKHIKEDGFSKKRMEYWFVQGLSVDAQDNKGKTLLMHAYEAETAHTANPSKRPGARDFMKIIQYLIDSKANLNLQDADGNTILMYAAKNFDFAMVSTFIGGRADPSIPDKKGDTPRSFLEKNRSNKPKGYSDEEIDFLTSISFEPPKEKGE